MASGEYRRPQSDNGVSFRCLRLKCELYLNVCLSISISLCPAHRLFNSFSTLRSTKITLAPSLFLSLLAVHYAIGELIKSLANWQIVNCDFCFVSSNSSSPLWAPHAFKATLQMLCFCFICRFLKRVWPHKQRLYWSLAWHMANARLGRNTFSSDCSDRLIGKSIDQLYRQCGATSLTVSELGSSFEIFS